MKKKKQNTLIEHYLIPTALFVLNTCLVHVIYLYASGPIYSFPTKLIMTLSLILLGASLIFKTKTLLTSSILLYAIVVNLI